MLKATLKFIKNLINNQFFLVDEPEKGYPVTPCMDVYNAKIQSDRILDKLKLIVTVAATTVLSIFTSCSGYTLSISVGIKCAILHILFLNCFNVNMLHVQSCPFSASKPFTLSSRLIFTPASFHTLLIRSSENFLL